MSKYTTGEIAKLCGVSVRTVQYYDSRNILIPSELSEGGRRLYSEQDLKQMKVICFLREAGISINSIGELLSEKNPGGVISVLLKQQEQLLQKEINDRKTKLELIDGIRRELKSVENFSVESIGDIAYAMEHRKKLKQLHAALVIMGLPLCVIQWTAIILLIASGIWWPIVVWVLLAIPYAIWVSVFYFKRIAYICPQCHEVFKPHFKEAFFAKHTPSLRKLTCTCCGYHGFCVEVYGKETNKDG
ncbi:MAG: MerR family transcriptional regulator [Bulleidia sp.]